MHADCASHNNTYNYPLYKIPHFNSIRVSDQGTCIFLNPIVCQMCVCFREDHTALPPVSHYTLFCPLGKNPEINPALLLINYMQLS